MIIKWVVLKIETKIFMEKLTIKVVGLGIIFSQRFLLLTRMARKRRKKNRRSFCSSQPWRGFSTRFSINISRYLSVHATNHQYSPFSLDLCVTVCILKEFFNFLSNFKQCLSYRLICLFFWKLFTVPFAIFENLS